MASPLSDSLVFLIGRRLFDGADPVSLAGRHSLSVEAVNQAGDICRERLSRHFAQLDGHEYRLLSNDDLGDRDTETIRLLLQWREAAIQEERLNEKRLAECDDDTTGALPEPADESEKDR